MNRKHSRDFLKGLEGGMNDLSMPEYGFDAK